MMRRLTIPVFVLSLWLPRAAAETDAIKAALASIPSDAIAFVCIPSVSQLDTDYQQAVSDLGLQPFVPPPASSLLGMMRQTLPWSQGLDVNGPLSIVVMPAATLPELGTRAAVLLSTKDPHGLLTAMGGQEGEGGVWSVTLFGPPMSAMVARGGVVVAQTPGTAKMVADSSSNIASRLKEEEIATLRGLDLAVWIDGERTLSLLKPQLDGLFAMFAMAQAASGPMGAQQAEAGKQQMDLFVGGVSSLTVGLSVDRTGIGLRGALRCRAGSDLAKQWNIKTTTGSLLKGLPNEDYMLAFGQVYEPEAVEAAFKNLDPYIAMTKDIEGVDSEDVASLGNLLKNWARATSATRAMVQLLPGESSGVFAIAGVVETTHSGRWLDMMGQAVNLAKSIVPSVVAANGDLDDDVKSLINAISYKREHEKIGGSRVDRLALDLSAIEEIDDDARKKISQFIGEDGLTIRLAAASENTVAIGFGGGARHMGELIDQARSGGSPLESDPGIKKVSARMPKARTAVVFVAVDRILAGIQKVATMIGEKGLPFQMPPVDTPLALSTTGGDGWARFDLLIPTELLVAGKNAAMMAVAGQAAAGNPQGAPVQPPNGQ